MKPIIVVCILCVSGVVARAQGIRFEDASDRAALRTGGPACGVAVSDYDGDGRDDLYIAAQGGKSALFRNLGDATFEETTAIASVGVAGGAVNPLWGDIDNDGDPDLFVGVRSYAGDASRLFENNGDGTFTDISATSGMDMQAVVGTAAFGDYDGDGRLDLFVATRESYDRLYRNTGDPEVRFENVAGSSNVLGYPESIAMQATWADYDLDGRLDLFAVHDGNLVSRLYRQTGAYPPFDNTSQRSGLTVARSSMGVAWGDYDNDGWPDVYVTNIARGNLFRNRGDGTFEDVTVATGSGRNGMAWGTVFADLDNDGDLDLFIANTSDYDGLRSMLYENRGGVFVDVAAEAGAAVRTNALGVASGDFDGDGRIDIVVADEGGRNTLLLNRSERGGSWLKIDLVGTTSNRMAIGASLRAVADGITRYRTVDGGSSYCSQQSPTLHVGLGGAVRVDTLDVRWPDGSVQRFVDVPVNASYRLEEGNVVNVSVGEERTGQPLNLSSYPNPFDDIVTFAFTVDAPREVSLEVFDIIGRRVRTLQHGTLLSGKHAVVLHRDGLPAGLYLARLRAGSQAITRLVIAR